MSASAIIRTENLTKDYKSKQGRKCALDNLTLSVEPGEIFGYLGPNGAGKTTTIRILLDLIRPTMGSAWIFEKNTQQESLTIRQRVGYIPGELNLWANQTGRAVVNYFSRVRGGVEARYVQQLTERLQLNLALKIRDYSTGNKRKLGLVLAMMHQPDLLILDEPTSGLDPLMQQTFNDLMREWRAAGRTVFLSSHVLSEVQAICDRVAILRDGQLKAVERVSTLTHADFRWITVHFRDAVMVGHLADVPGVSDIDIDGHALRLRHTGDFDPLLRALSEQHVVDMQIKEPTLEEIFLAYYGDKVVGHDTEQHKETA